MTKQKLELIINNLKGSLVLSGTFILGYVSRGMDNKEQIMDIISKGWSYPLLMTVGYIGSALIFDHLSRRKIVIEADEVIDTDNEYVKPKIKPRWDLENGQVIEAEFKILGEYEKVGLKN